MRSCNSCFGQASEEQPSTPGSAIPVSEELANAFEKRRQLIGENNQ